MEFEALYLHSFLSVHDMMLNSVQVQLSINNMERGHTAVCVCVCVCICLYVCVCVCVCVCDTCTTNHTITLYITVFLKMNHRGSKHVEDIILKTEILL